MARLRWIAAPAVSAACLLVASATPASTQEAVETERQVMLQRYLTFPSLLNGGSVAPHWMADGSRFWYADTTSGDAGFFMVDPELGTVTPVLPDQLPIGSVDQLSEPVSRPGEVESPARGAFAVVRDHNLWLRHGSEAGGVQVTYDGTADNEWIVSPGDWVRGFWTGTGAIWSPDGRKLALKKVDGRAVEKLPYIRFLDPGAPVAWNRFPRAGDPTFQTDLYVLDVESGELVRLDTGPEPDQRLEFLGWRGQNKEVLFLRLNRRHTRLDLMAANPRTGSSRIVLTESADTYLVGGGHGFERHLLTMLPDGERFIWKSERDGWDHFYLYDFDGRMIRRLTRGRFPVLEVIGLNGDWLLFTGRSEERPYDKYPYRIRLDGTGLTRLSEAPGSHEIELSPSGEYFLDTHSSLDRPPSVDLRRADGSLIRTLSKASVEGLAALEWIPPEAFVVKALDGETDLYGVLYKPYDFDPAKTYPVVEYIYDGEQMSLRAFKSPFTSFRHLRAIAQLGFIVIIADGPGTPERGREFRQADYMRQGQLEIAEHVGILKQLAAQRSYMDLDRVGIIGHSHGGYQALRALLAQPEVYHVGIAMSPSADLFDDLHFYFEPQMGYPQDNPDGYEKASNLRLAENLQGHLLMMVGTEDYGRYAATLRMVAEFVRLGKRHDLVILPGQPHEFEGASDDYSFEVGVDYLVEHLDP